VPAFEAGIVDLDPLGASAAGDHDELFDVVIEHLQRRLTELVGETETS
jgi:hypothetical protein